ncbi:LLM class flavin-dependent oxidoreductase [Bacillus sp. Marseille-P3661]|uniref:LLM class flavin-dependent oxidoreductase n=1 Tax=Bacillus sp. Marseille-P3661 TaxID=1936234 RepID=UPI000C838DCA|nr:LLM class flavin-dependent oxidoreductase [Bacillus sp. Marseille-P3661]
MKFYLFHLMPYKYLPEDFEKEYGQAWVKLPNKLYDPEVGNRLYNEYLNEMEYAEELGFDGVCVNEHHQTAYGNMPSPNIMAATLARRTKNIKISIIGNALPLREHPLRVAEEVAMLDVITGGRIISGFVRGIGAEYHAFGVNPNESRERFLEAHDLIMEAWEKEGPFSFEGKYYNFEYVNVWPRTYQQPHPPIWIPSQGSQETIEWTSQKKYTYLQTYSSYSSVRRSLLLYQEMAKEKWGYTASPDQLGWALPIYVAETDEQAVEEAREPMELLFKLLYMKNEYLFPPGYLSEKSEPAVLSRINKRSEGGFTIERLMDEGYVIVGSPKTVSEKLIEAQRDINFGVFVTMLQFGNLSHEMTMKNMELFSKEVMPAVKAKVGVKI